MHRDRTARLRIRQFLAASGPVVDPSGYATGVLKDAIGYSGSSVAFIQLIATMDREGEIAREIRGKRTYKIEGLGVPPTPTADALAPVEPARATATVAVPGQPTIEIDYTLLAQALIRELLVATVAAKEAPDTAAAEEDQLKAERDEYARRLKLARAQLDELLGKPISAGLRGDDAAAGRTTD
ncbi:hypothetical protein LO772_30535 [Yinghuangia sp. ASG 101]|uniref:hypothetical protein n=1 Tax=Yinghuangia sp. ASG 101 TaxID=2896848 RepID=UPI001E428A24|nr:hypothetical protein [Yinghuangia sp. ASG 101]UGQ11097.1 hypothetical protein LO772_30535 [Yinghuangia sp. ASG 101]